MSLQPGSPHNPDDGSASDQPAHDATGPNPIDTPLYLFGSAERFRLAIDSVMQPFRAALPPAIEEQIAPVYKQSLDELVCAVRRLPQELAEHLCQIDRERLIDALGGDKLVELFLEESDARRVVNLTRHAVSLILGQENSFGVGVLLGGRALMSFSLGIDPAFDTGLNDIQGEMCSFAGNDLFRDEEKMFELLGATLTPVWPELREPVIFYGEQLIHSGAEGIEASDVSMLHNNSVILLPLRPKGELSGALVVIAQRELLLHYENPQFLQGLAHALSRSLARIKDLQDRDSPSAS